MQFTETVVSVVGARPHFVKASPLVRALAKCRTKHIVLHTGQHYDRNMSAAFFDELDLPAPDINLNIGSGTHAEQTGRIMIAVEHALLEIRPKAVVVYGDTNSTLAATLAAAKCYFPLVHIEAGVRCNNRRMPEEINRKLIDHSSDYLVCPSERAVANLAREGITEGVMNLGDFMYDTYLAMRAAALARMSPLVIYRLQPRRYVLSTIHRELSTKSTTQLVDILNALGSLGEPVILPMHPRSRQRLKESGYVPVTGSQLQIIEPVGYVELLTLLMNARKVVTDSGGIQKEAYWAGTPCVTIMTETTWPETIATGWNVLVGLDMGLMRAAVASDFVGGERPEVYGPAGAAQRLVDRMGWT